MQLEQFRIKQGLSYKKLADFIGVTGVSPAVTVLRWCKGSRIPRPAWMKKIKSNRSTFIYRFKFYG